MTWLETALVVVDRSFMPWIMVQNHYLMCHSHLKHCQHLTFHSPRLNSPRPDTSVDGMQLCTTFHIGKMETTPDTKDFDDTGHVQGEHSCNVCFDNLNQN